MGDNNNIFIRITAQSNLDDTQKQLQRVVQQAADLEEEYGDLTRQMQQTAKESGKGSQEYQRLANAATQNRKSIEALTKGVKLSDLSMNALQARAANLRETLNSVSRAADPKGFEELKEELEDTERAMEKLDTTSSKGRILGELKVRTLAAVSAAYWTLKNAIGNAFNTIVDFEQANATLAAIMGKSQNQITALTEDAQRLGAITSYTASQMTELQTELAKLGFTEDEILAATESVQRFATATGSDLASAASLAGASLRAFGLEANEMERAVSVMAVATTKTALDFNALDTAMATIAPVARSFGFTIEDTTTLLGMLANSGFDASSAATATRNIVLNLADANGKLATALGKPIKSMDDLIPALIQLRDKGVDLGEALELTDKRSVSAFNTFLAGADDLQQLRESITDVSAEFKMMESERLNSVAGSMKLLESAWEGFILQFYNSKGLFKEIVDLAAKIVGGMQSAVQWIQDNSTAVKTFIGILATYLATGKAVTLWRAADIAAIIAQTKAKLAEITVTKAARIANEALKKSLLKSPWGLIAIGITAAVSGLILWIKHAKEADKVQKAINDTNERAAEIEEETVAKIKAEQNALNSLVDAIIKTRNNEKLRSDLIESLKKQYPSFLGDIESEKVTNGLLQGILMNVNAEYERKITLMKQQAKAQAYQETLVDLNKQLLKQEQDLTKATKEKKKSKLRAEIEETQKAIDKMDKGYVEAMEDVKKAEDDINTFNSIDRMEKRIGNLLDEIKEKNERANKASTEEERKFYEDQASQLNNQLTALQVQYDAAKKKASEKNTADAKKDLKAEAEKAKKLRAVILQEEQNTYNAMLQQGGGSEDDYAKQIELAKKIANGKAQVQIDALDKKSMTEREYNAQVRAIELERDADLKEIENKQLERKAELTNRMTELDVQQAEAATKALNGSEGIEAQKVVWGQYYSERKRQMDEKEQLEYETLQRENITAEEAEIKRSEIAAKYAQERNDITQEEASKYVSIEQDALRSYQREVDKANDEVEKAEGNGGKIAAIQRRYDAEMALYQAQEEALRNEYETTNMSYQDYCDKQVELERNKNNAIIAMQKDKTKAITDGFQQALDYMQKASDLVFEALGSSVQAELDALDEEYTTDAEEAKKNANKKYITEEEYEKKKAALEMKQAKYAKAQALINAAINTAMAIVTTLAQMGATPWGIAMAAIAGAMGAAQMAIIASKPLAQYEKGRKGGKGEYALVGEKGAEIMYVPQGASIIPHDKINDQEAWGAYGVPKLTIPEMPYTTRTDRFPDVGKTIIDYDKLGEAVARNIPSQKSVSISVDRNGINVTDGYATTRYLNRKYAGSWN